MSQRFEDLQIWQAAMENCIQVHELMKNCKNFGLRDQMIRCAVSVPPNISEGYERQTNKEFIQFLYIAKGSNGELRTQIHLAKAFGYLEEKVFDEILAKLTLLSTKIQAFINARKAFNP
jgi:four helix bundle protein